MQNTKTTQTTEHIDCKKQVMKVVFKNNAKILFGIIEEQYAHSFKLKTAYNVYIIPHDQVDRIIVSDRKFGDVPPKEDRW